MSAPGRLLTPIRLVSLGATALAVGLSALCGALGTGHLLGALPALLISRCVYADAEGVLTAALLTMVLMVSITNPPALGALVALLGTFLAAEVAGGAVRVRRAGSLRVLPAVLESLRLHALATLGAGSIGALAAVLDAPGAVSLTASMLAMTLIMVGVGRALTRTPADRGGR